MATFISYIILGALLMGIIALWAPAAAHRFTKAAHEWLTGIPSAFYDLITVFGSSYAVGRSAEKIADIWQDHKTRQAEAVADAATDLAKVKKMNVDQFDRDTQ